MHLTNGDLLAIEHLLDKKINPLEVRIDKLENRFDNLENRFDNLENRFDSLEGDVKAIKCQLEQDIIPRLTNIEMCYIGTYDRYVKSTEKIEKYMEQQDLLTAVVLDHERKFKQMNM